eukprot:6493560-Prymnesium_polylepis.2
MRRMIATRNRHHATGHAHTEQRHNRRSTLTATSMNQQSSQMTGMVTPATSPMARLQATTPLARCRRCVQRHHSEMAALAPSVLPWKALSPCNRHYLASNEIVTAPLPAQVHMLRRTAYRIRSASEDVRHELGSSVG